MRKLVDPFTSGPSRQGGPLYGWYDVESQVRKGGLPSLFFVDDAVPGNPPTGRLGISHASLHGAAQTFAFRFLRPDK